MLFKIGDFPMPFFWKNDFSFGRADDVFATARAKVPRRSMLLVLKVALSAIAVAVILISVDLPEVGASLLAFDLRLIPALFLSLLVSSSLRALRLKGLLAARGTDPGFLYLLLSVLTSVFFRQFLPSMVGGDAVRGYDAWKAGATPETTVVALFIDRLLGTVALLAFVVAALLFWRNPGAQVPDIGPWLALAVLLAAASLWVLFRPGTAAADAPSRWRRAGLLGRLRSRFGAAATAYRGEYRTLGWAMLVSVALQANVVLFYWLLCQALGLPIGPGAFFIIVPLAMFVMMAPLSINGIGLREAAFIFLLGLWAVPVEQALAYAWAEYAMILSYGLVGGVVYLLRGPTMSRALARMSPVR